MYALIFTAFINLVGFGIVLPLLPLYAQFFGASPEVVTLVAASYTAAQWLSGPFWGWLSDRIGRKPVLLITIGGTFVGYVLLAASSSLWMLFAARFFGGAMAGNMGVSQALISDITRAEERTRAIARLSGAAGLGFVAGPAVGGLLGGSDPAHPEFLLPYIAAAAFSAVAFVLAILLIGETVTPEQKSRARQPQGTGAWRETLAAPQPRLLMCLMFGAPFVFAGIEVVFVLWSAPAWHWGPTQNGYFYAWMGACHVLLQWFAIGRLATRIGERALIGLGALSLGAGALLMPLSPGVVGLYVAAFLMIFGVAANASSLNSMLSQYAGPDSRGRILGLGQVFSGGGRIIGPVIAGFVFSGLGMNWPFFVGAITMAAIALGSRFIAARRAADIGHIREIRQGGARPDTKLDAGAPDD